MGQDWINAANSLICESRQGSSKFQQKEVQMFWILSVSGSRVASNSEQLCCSECELIWGSSGENSIVLQQIKTPQESPLDYLEDYLYSVLLCVNERLCAHS